MKKFAFLLICVSSFSFGQSWKQPKVFSKEDTLKGSNTKFRNFWDVKRYDLSVEPDFAAKSIAGSNRITGIILHDTDRPVFQIDLQKPMIAKNIQCSFATQGIQKQDGDFIFIASNKNFKKGDRFTIDIQYSGNPTIAKTAPWDGGWVFTKDPNGNPWMSAADEGIGASVWLPIKDIWSDEPDEGITMTIITPNDLVGIGNGQLISKKNNGSKTAYLWEVKNTINPYSIIPNIGKYVNFKDQYNGENGQLLLDYWVLENNLEKAKKQFAQVKPMLKSFEYWFGPYPFYKDSYKLVESPYLGMEHQSNIAYGNGYRNGFLGQDLSGTGIGLLWDYIIVHESGHEWFANNITAKDQADLWIHEAFTMYSEVLFTESFIDKSSAEQYMQGIRRNIMNDKPIIGSYGVRDEGSGDMYYKGASMLHTIRQIIGDDKKFRAILRGLNADFKHQTVSSADIENYISTKAGFDFSTIFDQYLRTVKIPVLEYVQKGDVLKYRYTDTVKNLKLPVKLGSVELQPTENWQEIRLNSSAEITPDKNYYIHYKPLSK